MGNQRAALSELSCVRWTAEAAATTWVALRTIPTVLCRARLRGTLIFNRPLGPAEIAKLYNQGRDAQGAGKMAGLVAGHHFNEGRAQPPTISPATATTARSRAA